MNPWPVDAEVEESHLPRPGHADLVGAQKYGHRDVRNVLERASARETAARVAAGALAKEFLRALGVEVFSHVIRIASVSAAEREPLGPEDFAGVDDSPVRCLDREAERAMVEEINRLRKANESLGGIFEVRAFGLLPGLGSYVALGRRASTAAWPRRWSRSRPSRASPSARRGRSRRCPARSPTTRSSGRRSSATTARPTAPAGSRAGCRTASRWSSAAR